ETLADLTGITGSNLKWYSNLSGTIQIPSSTLLKDGVTYYVSQTVNGCEGELLMVKAKQDPIPPVGEAQQPFCTGETIADLIAGGQNLAWYSDPAGTNPIPTSTVLVDGTPYYVTQTIGG